MRKGSLRFQTIILTCANMLVRGAGFLMRILLSRWMGAETIGIMELASSAHMLAITPVTAGLPLAVSRLTAKAAPSRQTQPLAAGRWLVNWLSLIIMPVFLLLAPLIAQALGDIRTLPSLFCTVPCVFILGHSAVLNGYCYGLNQALPPALSEILEQALRFALTILFISSFRHLATAYYAALPALATLVAEALGLVAVVWLFKFPIRCSTPEATLIQKTARLSVPPTLSRFMNTGLRSINAILIPQRLQASGLSAAEATARFGMLTGMVMPLMMLPGVLTSALAMLAGPALAAREHHASALQGLTFRMLCFTFIVSGFCGMMLYAFAPVIATQIYRQAELAPLIRLMSPTVLMSGVQQVLSGMIAGLGRQKEALYGGAAGAGLTLILSWFLTALPELRQNGAAIASMAGQALALCWNLILMGRLFEQHAPGDKSCPAQP